MIKATLTYKNAVLKQVKVSGHSFYKQANKTDIVCAACSVLVRTVMRYWQQVNALESNQIEDGFVCLVLKDNYTDEVAGVLQLGLSDLEQEFPKNIELTIKRD